MVIDTVEATNNGDGRVELRFTADDGSGLELELSDHTARSVVWQLAKAIVVQ